MASSNIGRLTERAHPVISNLLSFFSRISLRIDLCPVAVQRFFTDFTETTPGQELSFSLSARISFVDTSYREHLQMKTPILQSAGIVPSFSFPAGIPEKSGEVAISAATAPASTNESFMSLGPLTDPQT